MYQDRNLVEILRELVTINEKVNLTKKQHEVSQMVFNLYQMSISEYLQEAMRFDIEEGHGWNEAEPKKPW